MANPFDQFDEVNTQANPFDQFDEPVKQQVVAQPKETGLFEDLVTAAEERWNEFTNPKPSYLGTGGIGRIVSPLTSPEMVNAGASLGGFAYDVIGAGLKQGLRAAKSFDEAPNQVDSEWEAIKPYVSKGVEYAKDAWSGVEKFDPALAADTKRLVDLTGLGTAKSVISGAGKILPGSGLSTEEQLIKGIGRDISTGTKKTGLVPSRVKSYEEIANFNNDMKSAVPTIIKQKNNISFVDSEGNLIKGKIPETHAEWSQAIPQAQDNIMSKITKALKESDEAGVTVSKQPQLDVIKAFEDSPMYQGMMREPKYDSVLADIAERKQRIIDGIPLTPSESNATITTLNRLIKTNTDPLQNFFLQGLVKAEREALNTTIDSLRNTGVGQLKKDWGALQGIEPKVAQRAVQLGKTSGNMNYWDMATLAEGIAGLATLNPAIVGAAIATKGGNAWLKWLNNPDRAVKKMFAKVEKKMGQIPSKPPINPLEGDISGARPTPLGLPMPERGFTLQGEPTSPDIIDVPFRTMTPPRQITNVGQPLQLEAPRGIPNPPNIYDLNKLKMSANPDRLYETALGDTQSNLLGIRKTRQVAITPEAIKFQQVENIPSNPMKTELPSVEQSSPNAIIKGMMDASKKSFDDITSRITNVKRGGIENGKEVITFNFDGKPQKGILDGRNRDLVIGASSEIDKGIAGRIIIDGHSNIEIPKSIPKITKSKRK